MAASALGALAAVALAPSVQAAPISGVFRAIPDGRVLAGGLRNKGDPSAVVARAPAKDAPPAERIDPRRLCLPIGPFRMMAEPRAKIQVVPSGGDVVILFEDIAHGFFRTVHLSRGHRPQPEPSFEGDSVGRIANGVLTVDTVGFNAATWLNAQGARHTTALHLVEHIRPVLGARYLEYRVTATDPTAFPAPVSYTRYYERTDEPVGEDVCRIEDDAVLPSADGDRFGAR